MTDFTQVDTKISSIYLGQRISSIPDLHPK